MTNQEHVAAWHRDKPEWTRNFSARDWDVADAVAQRLDIEAAAEPKSCTKSEPGWYCVLPEGHDGPCVQHKELDL